MQIQTGPSIPAKPLHLSNTDNELYSKKPTNVMESISTPKDDTRNPTLSSFPRQQRDDTATSAHNKPLYQMNSQKAMGKTVYRSPRRPKAALTMHHLYLYSSSSPHNLLATNNKHPVSSADLGHSSRLNVSGQYPTSSQGQARGAAGTQSPYLSHSYKSNSGAGLQSSYSSPWTPESHGKLHSSSSLNNSGATQFQSNPVSISSGSSSIPPLFPNSSTFSSSTYPSQNRTQTTPNYSKSNDNNSKGVDGVVAQLVEMGFAVTDVKRAVASSKDHTIQSYLDILVRKESTSTDPDHRQHQSPRTQETSVQSSYYQQNTTIFEATSFKKPYVSAVPASSASTSIPGQHASNVASPLSTKTDSQYRAPSATSYTKPIPTTPSSPPQSFQFTKSSFYAQPTTSTPPASRPTSSSGIPVSRPIDSDTIKKAIKARARGNDLFKLGYYREAEKSYNQALALLPDRHDVTAVISNNRAAARLKNGQYRQCIMDCTFVIDWARQKCASEGKSTTIELEGGTSIRWYDQLGKALHRKAESMEKMVRIMDAQLIYQELVNMDAGDAKAQAGLERCQTASSSTKPPPPPPPFSKSTASATTSTTSTHSAATTSSATAFPGLDYSIFETQQPSKAVAAMRARQAAQAKEETERLEKTDMVNARIDAWKRGKEKNIRALLSSLDTLLWPGAQWRGAPVNELLEPKKVKMCYMKAIAKVHPDKLSPTTTIEQRLLASGIFSVLNQAWEDFRSNNKI